MGAVSLFCTSGVVPEKEVDWQVSSKTWLPLLPTAGQELSSCNGGRGVAPTNYQVWDRQEGMGVVGRQE